MKLKKVAAICGQTGMFHLLDQVDEDGEVVRQWLGDGSAAYPIVGLPYMELGNVCTMFDIPEKKREKLIFRKGDAPGNINWEDTDHAEHQLAEPKLCVRYEGMELLPLRTSAGVTFIQAKYLAPLDDLDYMRLYERKFNGGGVYIMAKIGMVAQAVIMPENVVNGDFVSSLESLTDLCRSVLQRKSQAQGTLSQEGDTAWT